MRGQRGQIEHGNEVKRPFERVSRVLLPTMRSSRPNRSNGRSWKVVSGLPTLSTRMVPESRTLSRQACSAGLAPAASIARSAPRPRVRSRTAPLTVFPRGVQDRVGAQPLGNEAARRMRLADDRVRRAHVLGHLQRHEPNRTGPRDEHVITGAGADAVETAQNATQGLAHACQHGVHAVGQRHDVVMADDYVFGPGAAAV